MKEKIINMWEEVLGMQNVRPYVFKTRLERTIRATKQYADEEGKYQLDELCTEILEKMKFISDQSNQTSDGVLKSYTVLQNEFERVMKAV